MRRRIRSFLSLGAFVFSVQVTTAALLSLWIAIALKLDSPQWAPITVWIVAQPSHGKTLSKSLYRLLGTFVGAAVAILFIALFGHMPWAFVVALTVWMSLCAAGANLVRYFRAYGAVLAGYTTAIVGLLVFSQPEHIYNKALARVSCIFLGIALAGVVSSLFVKNRAKEDLILSMRETFAQSLRWVLGVLNEERRADLRGLERKLVKDISEIEEKRSYASAESFQIRLRSKRVRSFMASLFNVLSAGRSLATQRNQEKQQSPEVFERLRKKMERAISATEKEISQEKRHRLPHLATLKEELTRGFTASLFIERCDELLTTLIAVDRDYRAMLEGAGNEAFTQFSLHRDWKGARKAALGTSIAVAITGAIWVLTGWSEGPLMLMMTAVNCGIMSINSQPLVTLRRMLIGSLLAYAAALITQTVLLSYPNNIPLLVLSLIVFMIPGGLLIASSPYSTIGTIYTSNFCVFLAPSTHLVFEPASFLNLGLGFFASFGITYIIFKALYSAKASDRQKGLIRDFLSEVGKIREEKSTLDINVWGVSMYQRIGQMIQLSADAGETDTSFIEICLAALDIGRGALRLQNNLKSGHLKPQESQVVSLAIGSLEFIPANLGRAQEVVLNCLRNETAPSLARDALMQMSEGLKTLLSFYPLTYPASEASAERPENQSVKFAPKSPSSN